MYLIVIGWLYVILMMALVSDSLLKALMRFVLLGVFPVALLLWLRGRRRQPSERTSSGQVAPSGSHDS